jgi:hypothetical protein
MLTPAVGIRYLGHLVIGGERAYDIESGGAYALKAPRQTRRFVRCRCSSA